MVNNTLKSQIAAELERAGEDTATSMQRTRKLEDLLTGKEAEISEATHGAVATEERLQKCEQEVSKREASSERALAAARRGLQSTQEESWRLREDYEQRLDEASRTAELERYRAV